MLSVFSVVAGLLVVLAIFVYEFVPSPSGTNIAYAFLSSPCFPSSGNTPTNSQSNLTETPVPVTPPISGIYTFRASFMFPTYLTQTNFPATGTCVELAITEALSPTTVRKYYSWMSEVGTLRPDAMGYDISIPYNTTQLANTSATLTSDGYTFNVSVYGNGMIYTNSTSPNNFDVCNASSGSGEEQYQITSPANNQTFSAAFTMRVYKPASAVAPAVVLARLGSAPANPVLPWSNTLPAGSPSGTEYVFSIPFFSPGQYVYRACPNGMSSSQLSLTDPAPRCSPAVVVTFSTTSTTNPPSSNTNTPAATNTNSSTTSTPYPPTISAPTSGSSLNELSTITGYAEPGIKVRIDLARIDPPTAGSAAVTYFLIKTAELTTPTSSGTLNLGIDPLKPARYRIAAASYKNGAWSQAAYTEFTIKPVSISITNKSPTPLTGEVTFEAIANRSDLGTVSFYRAPSSTTTASPDILIGSGNRVVGSYAKWSLTFNSKGHPNGTYRFFAQGQVAGTTANSSSFSCAIQNVSGTSTTTPPSGGSGTSTNTNSTQGSATPGTNNEPTSTNTNSTIANQPPTGEQQGEATPTATELTVAIDLQDNPAADPRQSGEATPETLAVQAVTNIQSNANLPTGLKLSGIGPSNSIVTIYIFSSPIVITTTTDASGNWTYTLDRPLDNGSHEVYVTVTDSTGSVEQKSNPMSFFVAEARAVTQQDYKRYQQQQSRMYETYTKYYLLIAGLLVGFAVVLFLYFRLRNHHRRVIARIE
ncbi:MAG: Ig-like domain-containing protein [Candidatus Kerfeldbacteria bacterium]